ncbi:MAG: hypothetical protein JJT89_00740 [Nitriliruptoraceae bacterium]|nr:hypothetical protein [Nitriliruptoraceae bacterium]
MSFMEPAYARAVDWLLCDAVASIAGTARTSGSDAAGTEAGSYYLRLSTRPIDQAPFERAVARLGPQTLRRQVLAGAYRLHDPAPDGPGAGEGPVINLATSGALVPEVLAVADQLALEGVRACVVDVTSSSCLYRAWRATIRRAVRQATVRDRPGALHAPFVPGAPVVTVHDASPHAMAWLGGALGVEVLSLGVDGFGESGTIGELYRAHDLDADHITNVALAAL